MEIEIKGLCNGCPFRYSEDHSDSVGFDTLEICVLGRHLRLENFFIECYDSWKSRKSKKMKMPKWCPLKKEEVSIRYIKENK